MNISTAIMLFLAWQMLSKNGGIGGGAGGRGLSGLSGLLNNETKELLSSVSKLTDKTASSDEKTSAIFQMITNPTVQTFTGGLFGNKGNGGSGTAEATASASPQDVTYDTNEEGYVFRDIPSEGAKDFFKPVENIANVEARHKLYKLYDNWYTKN
jgi:hypothetical protein